jgi:hypothetical protein
MIPAVGARSFGLRRDTQIRLRSMTGSVVVDGISRKEVVERSRDDLAREDDFLVSIQYKYSKQRSLPYEFAY